MESSGTNQTDTSKNEAMAGSVVSTTPGAAPAAQANNGAPVAQPSSASTTQSGSATSTGTTSAAGTAGPSVAETASTGGAGASAASANGAGAAVQPTETVVEPVVAAPLSTDVTIEALLEECVTHNASDLHIQADLPPTLRIDGTLRPMTTYPVLDEEMVKKLIFSTLDEEQQKIFLKDKEFDYSFAFGDLGRFRVNAFHERGKMAAAFRLIPNVLKTLEELGVPGVVESFAEHPHGLVLVTGPTGSGKSTTLAALIDKINTEKALHIITIEDPIEFTHRSKRSLVAQREVHYDTFSFAAALRSILREDPDVVLIGEMRDLETIQAAITVAETGHLVFATLHTNSAAQSVDRIIDVFPAHQQSQIRAQLATVLNGICSQRLIPAISGGRVCAAEVLVATPAIRAIIREGKTHQLDMAIQTGAELGMQTMDRELAKLVKAGTISYDVAHEYAVNVPEFERLARG